MENFGRMVADYGDFFSFIAPGKQPLKNLPSVDVNEALNSRNWHNVLEIQFENHNLTVFPLNEVLLHNGEPMPVDEYMSNYKVVTAFQQLVDAIEKSAPAEKGGNCAMKKKRLIVWLPVLALILAGSVVLSCGALSSTGFSVGKEPSQRTACTRQANDLLYIHKLDF